jgi:tetratricopeptide (TPR) repeat protein
MRLYTGKDYLGAIKALDTALQLNPRMDLAWSLRGMSNAGARNLPEAIADLTRAIELAPRQAAAFSARGQAFLDTNKIDQALADFTTALELNPAHPSALQSRAGIYLARKQYAEAIADCDAAMRAYPSAAAWALPRKNEARRLMTGTMAANALPAPALVSPVAGATFSIYPRETALVWAAIPGAASYVVEWDYKGGDTWASEQRGTSGVMIRSSEPKASLNFIGAQPGRWRVWAIDSQGTEGARSEWREFIYTR